MKSLTCTLSLLLLTICGSGAPLPGNDEPEYVSMFQLIVTPERFDGKIVAVTGFLSLGKEADELFISLEDEQNGILENGVSIIRTSDIREKKSLLDHKYVRVVGRFRVNNRLQSRFTSGGFTDVQHCEVWSDPQRPLRDRLKLTPGVN